MKQFNNLTILLTFAFYLLPFALSAQTPPQGFNYQAVARDATGNVLANTSISIMSTIRSTGILGSKQWQETHAVTTNQFGLFTLTIGQGVNTGGGLQSSFADVDWSSGAHFLQIEMDKTGGTNYMDMGTTQLLSVPYALYSENVKNVNDADADPTNELQVISLSNDTLLLSNGSTVYLGNYLDNTDNQTLSLTNDTLNISNGNNVIINVDDADADPTNELQAISLSNDTLFLSNGGAVYIGNYLDNTDNQTLSLTSDTLSISNGNNVILIDNVNDADADSTNELQTLSFANDTIYLSDGGSVALPYDSAIWSKNGSDIYYNSGKIGIGTTNPFYALDVRGDVSDFLGYFQNINSTTGIANGILGKGDAYNTLTGSARGGWFLGTGGSTSGVAYGSGNFAFAYGTSIAYGVYSNATGGTTTGRKYAFYGLGDGYFSQDVGIGTDTLDAKLVVRQDSAADIFNLYDGSVNVFTVKDGGNVGIGTTGPKGKLDVAGGISAGSYAGFNTPPSNGMIISGNVGIGTTNPGAALEIRSAIPPLYWGSPSAVYGRLTWTGSAPTKANIYATTGNALSLGAGGTPDKLFIDSSGNVGIGTTIPQGVLDVSSTTGGFIVPRMTTTQRNLLTPVNGMIIYNTTDNQFNFYENGAWVLK